MIGRGVTFVVAAGAALVAAQAPEFSQQYRQRLGGAIDELREIVARFDADARAYGLDRPAAVARLKANPDALAARQADSAVRNVERYMRLDRQRADIDAAGPVARVAATFGDLDARIARRAFEDFKPAVPATAEGAVLLGAGGVGGYAFARLFGLMFRRRGKLRPA